MATYLTPFDPSIPPTGPIITSLGTEPGTLLCLNDSRTNIAITLADGRRIPLPAQAWRRIDVDGGNNAISWIQEMTLPITVPNSLVYIEAFSGAEAQAINEIFPAAMVRATLGNAVVTTLSNEGNAPGTLVIDVGTSTIAQLLKLYNDHFMWQVQQAGVAHTVLQGQTAGSPLLMGQAGDVSEVAGTLQIDQGVSQVNGQAAGGAFGVGVIVKNDLADHITTIGTHNLFSFAVTAAGLYRLSGYVEYQGTTGASIQCGATYTDDIGGNTAYFPLVSSGAATPPLLNGTAAYSSPLGAALGAITFFAKSGNIVPFYTNNTATPNDHVWVVLERLA